MKAALLALLVALGLNPVPVHARSLKADPAEAILAHHLFDYKMTTTSEDFIKKFGGNKEDTEYLKKVLGAKTSLPTAHRVGTVAVFMIDGQMLQVDFRRFSENIFYFNGHKYFWSRGLPLREHVERVTKLLNKGEGFTWFRFFVPKAEAGFFIPILIGAAATAGTAIVGALASSAITHYEVWKKVDRTICERKIKGGDKTYQDEPMCAEYMEIQKKKLQANPEIGAAKVALTEQKEDPIETTSEMCPHHMDGDDKDKFYKATFLLVKEKQRVRIKSEVVDKKLKIEVRDFLTNDIVATYFLNDENELDEIVIPNPKRDDSKKLTSADMKISAASNPSDPEIAAQLALHRRIYKRFGVRLTSCKAEKAEIDAAKAKQNTGPNTAPNGIK